ncbi:MAG: hypothetical protein AB7G37_03865 [Solirubrobacteraceae bacterium]
MTSLEEVNALIAAFSTAHEKTMRAERRTSMKSVLFDLPRRSSLGWEAIYEHGPRLVRELEARCPPEELGRRMRRVGSRPYAMQAFMLACGFLAARQQHLLDAGIEPGRPFAEDLDGLTTVIGFWGRLMRAYRGDDAVLPEAAGGALRILDDATVAEAEALLRPVTGEQIATIRRFAATLTLYCFILHGEQRDGIFGHGPYARPDGSTLFVQEYNDLAQSPLPWADTDAQGPFPAVAILYGARDVRVGCDLFGSMVVDPPDFAENVTHARAVVAGPDGLRALDDAEIDEVERAATAAQQELYLRAVGWDERFKITYGAPLFANHIAPFFTLAGERDAFTRIAAEFSVTAERFVDRLAGSDAIPTMWEHMADPATTFYWPAHADPGPDAPRIGPANPTTPETR